MAQAALRLVEGSSMDKSKALDAAVSQIERAFGKGSIMRLGKNSKAMDVDTISSGSIARPSRRASRAGTPLRSVAPKLIVLPAHGNNLEHIANREQIVYSAATPVGPGRRGWPLRCRSSESSS